MVPAEWFESLRKETFDAAEYVRRIHTFETCYVPGKIDSERREKVRTYDKQTETVHLGV
jgi:hypothetical protein